MKMVFDDVDEMLAVIIAGLKTPAFKNIHPMLKNDFNVKYYLNDNNDIAGFVVFEPDDKAPGFPNEI